MSKRIIALAILGAAFFAGSANATTWTYDGSITACNAAICGLVPIFVGDPVVGSITIDVGANDSFTLDNTFMDYSFLVGGVIPVEFPNPDGVFITGSGTTDADGDFVGGTLVGDFVGGTLGGLGGQVTIDLATGAFAVTVGFGTVFVADVAGSFTCVDCGPTVVPVPAAVWLMGSAMMGLVGLRRRKTA